MTRIIIETISLEATLAAIEAIPNAAVVATFIPNEVCRQRGTGRRRPKTGALLVICDQVPDWVGTIDQATKLCGSKSRGSVLDHAQRETPCNGFTFRRCGFAGKPTLELRQP